MQYDMTAGAPLFALMYSSHAVGEVTQSTLDSILHTSRERNADRDITGILLYRQGRFYQYLEGPECSVRELYRDICADARHTDLAVLLETDVATRRFADWSMGYEPMRESVERIPQGFRSTFADIEDVEHPRYVLRAVTELTHWYGARAASHVRHG